jgi:hypothetical protein
MKPAYPLRKPLLPPPGIHPALAAIVEALARQAARDDYVRRQGENDHEASGALRPLFQRPADR